MAKEGYDCEFVSPPPAVLQTECSICLLILREPHLISCCGHNFCRVCVERIQNYGKPCPLCNEDLFTTLRNKGLERALNELEVQCEHKGSGCSWSGELGALDNHLKGQCPLVEVECRYANCHHVTKRKDVSSHEASCGFRPFCCNWCQKYNTWHDDVTDHHWPVCPKYPVSCHQCKASVERQLLPHHVEEDCLLTLVDCEFSSVGCKARLPRVDLQGHLTGEQLLHLTMVNRKLVNENAVLSKRISALELRAAEKEAAMRDEIAHLKVKLNRLDDTEKAMEYYIGKKNQLLMLPITFELSTRLLLVLEEQECVCYSQFGGYKMRIQLFCKQARFKLPYIWIYIAVLAGEFDTILQWPFRGTVSVVVNHSCKTIRFAIKIGPYECPASNLKRKGDERHTSHQLMFWDNSSGGTVTVEQVILDTAL